MVGTFGHTGGGGQDMGEDTRTLHHVTSIKLLGYVRTLLPYQAQVALVGDCEFGNPLLLEYLEGWHWQYALRQAGDNLVMLKGTGRWQRLDSLPLSLGEMQWFGRIVLTRASAYPTHLVLYWKHGEKQPWFLATTCLCPQAALALYRCCMWIEEMFGDLKKMALTSKPRTYVISFASRASHSRFAYFMFGWSLSVTGFTPIASPPWLTALTVVI